MISVTVTNRKAVAVPISDVTVGAVGIPVRFSFSEDWDGLSKIAVFKAGSTSVEMAIFFNATTVPHEVLTTAYERLEIGIYGSNPQGTVVTPTVWADVGAIQPGAEIEEDPSEPTPSWVAQVQAAAETALEIAEDLQDEIGDDVAGCTEAKNDAEAAATAAAADALVSEGFAVGEQDGTPVSSGTYYHNNAKYYSEEAEDSATSANTNAGLANTYKSDAYEYRDDAAGFAAGKEYDAIHAEWVDITDPDSPYYQKNAAWYATQSESWAVGGTDTRTDEDIKNAKYYAELAAETAESIDGLRYLVPVELSVESGRYSYGKKQDYPTRLRIKQMIPVEVGDKIIVYSPTLQFSVGIVSGPSASSYLQTSNWKKPYETHAEYEFICEYDGYAIVNIAKSTNTDTISVSDYDGYIYATKTDNLPGKKTHIYHFGGEGNDWCFVRTPINYDPKREKPYPFVICNHGNGWVMDGSAEKANWTKRTMYVPLDDPDYISSPTQYNGTADSSLWYSNPTIEALLTAGYIVCGCENYGDGLYGNDNCRNACVDFYQHMTETYNVEDTCYMIGASNGGLTTLNAAYLLPGKVKAMILQYPLTCLVNQYDNYSAHRSGIRSAYGISNSSITLDELTRVVATHDPLTTDAVNGVKYSVFPPVKIWYSESDSVANYEVNTMALVSMLHNSNKIAETVQASGQHGDYTHFDPAGFVAWFSDPSVENIPNTPIGVEPVWDTKVDKVSGKGLSTNDYTTEEKTKLGALPTNSDLTTALNGKVPTTRKVNNKALSADITLAAGDIGYDSTATYSGGTIGAELTTLNSELSEADDLIDKLYDNCVIETASGAIASFSDGSDGLPVKKLTVVVEPVQEGSGDPAPDNICPITGHTGANVTRTGKNLAGMVIGMISTSNGAYSSSNDTYASTDFIKIEGSGQIVVSGLPTDVTQTGSHAFFYYDKNKNYLGYESKGLSLTKMTSSINANVAFIRFRVFYGTAAKASAEKDLVMANYGTTEEDFEAYDGQTIPITFPAAAGTVYGGTLTKHGDGTGTLVVTKYLAEIRTGAGKYSFSSGPLTAYANTYVYSNSSLGGLIVPNNTGDVTEAICTHLPSISRTVAGSAGNNIGIFQYHSGESNSVRFAFPKEERFSTYTKVNEWLDAQHAAGNTVVVVYPLKTPVSYTLTAEQLGAVLTTLYGENNVWADTGDVSVDYRADSRIYIDTETKTLRLSIAPIEDGTTSSQAYAQGEYFFHNGDFCKAKTSIASGATFTLNTNYEVTTVAAELFSALNS